MKLQEYMFVVVFTHVVVETSIMVFLVFDLVKKGWVRSRVGIMMILIVITNNTQLVS